MGAPESTAFGPFQRLPLGVTTSMSHTCTPAPDSAGRPHLLMPGQGEDRPPSRTPVPAALPGDSSNLTCDTQLSSSLTGRGGVTCHSVHQGPCRARPGYGWPGEALPGFWRSMVLSWLVKPPEEESPLDVASWLKWGSKDSSGCGAAAYLQGSKRRQARWGEGLGRQNHRSRRLAHWGVLNTQEARRGGEAK